MRGHCFTCQTGSWSGLNNSMLLDHAIFLIKRDMENKFSVIIVDDHEIFRNGLKMAIESLEYAEVVAMASDGQEFLYLLDIYKPDIIFMDIKMPIMNGIEATTLALQKNPNLNIIAISTYDDEDCVDSMLNAGIKGFLLKNARKEKIDNAMLSIIAGGSYFSNEIKRCLNSKKDDLVKINLTEREIEILKLISSGYNTKQISKTININEGTVEQHRNNMIKKNNCSNMFELISMSKDAKII